MPLLFFAHSESPDEETSTSPFPMANVNNVHLDGGRRPRLADNASRSDADCVACPPPCHSRQACGGATTFRFPEAFVAILRQTSFYLQVRHDICVNCNNCSIAMQCPSDAWERLPANDPYILKHKQDYPLNKGQGGTPRYGEPINQIEMELELAPKIELSLAPPASLGKK